MAQTPTLSDLRAQVEEFVTRTDTGYSIERFPASMSDSDLAVVVERMIALIDYAEAMKAENARLRAALAEIVAIYEYAYYDRGQMMAKEARKALGSEDE